MLSSDASQRNISYVQAGKRGFPQLDWNLKISWSLKVCKGSEKQIRGYISQENGKEKYREKNTHTHTHTHAYNMFRNNENVVKHKAQRSSLIAKEIKT